MITNTYKKKTSKKLKEKNIQVEAKIIRKSEYEYFMDLGTKINGYFFLEINLLNFDKNTDYKSLKCGVFEYGPREDFTIFKDNSVCSQLENKLVFSTSNFCSARYYMFKIPDQIGNEDIDWIFEKAYAISEMGSALQVGNFKSSDDMLNSIWNAGTKTVYNCIFPHEHAYSSRTVIPMDRLDFVNKWRGEKDTFVLVDGPRRDREVWVGDLLPEIRTCWYSFADQNTIRNSLQIFLDQQREDGFIPASSVSYQNFSEYCCWFIIVLHEYILFSGDFLYLEKIYLKLNKLLEYIKSILDDKGMLDLELMQTWAWTLARKGNVTSSQCVLYRAWICAANLNKWTGNLDFAKAYEFYGEKLKENILNYGWDEEAGAFRSVCSKDSEKQFSLDANVYAVIFGIGDEKKNNRCLDFVNSHMSTEFGTKLLYPPENTNGRNWPHNEHIWPFAVGFEVEALFYTGRSSQAIRLLDSCWGNMVRKGSDTFWEVVDVNTGDFMKERLHNPGEGIDTWNSYCHGWSAGVSYLMQAYIAGVMPLEPGFAKFSINPQLDNFQSVRATIPLKDSSIILKADRLGDGNIKIILTVPEGRTGVWVNNKYTCEIISGPGQNLDMLETGTYEMLLQE